MIRPVLVLLAVFTILLGLVYPAAITGIAQVAFPDQANGSLVAVDGRVVGSALIGQPFSEARYFWPRPSATTPPYNGIASSGSNWGPTAAELLSGVEENVDRLLAAHPTRTGRIPVDLVTASGSGLDPHVSPAGALIQVERVAAARRASPERVRELVLSSIEHPMLRIFGAPRVNVLELNIALDRMTAR